MRPFKIPLSLGTGIRARKSSLFIGYPLLNLQYKTQTDLPLKTRYIPLYPYLVSHLRKRLHMAIPNLLPGESLPPMYNCVVSTESPYGFPYLNTGEYIGGGWLV